MNLAGAVGLKRVAIEQRRGHYLHISDSLIYPNHAMPEMRYFCHGKNFCYKIMMQVEELTIKLDGSVKSPPLSSRIPRSAARDLVTY